MPAERRHTADCYRRPLANKARLRAVAARYIATHGLAGFNLHHLAAQAGLKFDLARHYYRTNQALIADIIRVHQAAIGEALAEPLLALGALPGATRLQCLARAYLVALTQHGDGHRTRLAATAALPGIAEAASRGDLWLHGVFADAVAAAAPGMIGDDRDTLARSLLLLLDDWALRVEDDAAREECARLLVRMIVALA